ncbi:MAG: CehA/McbA family metallohydrolase [Candidatus Omnitrophica bacterium]|nr:CehA/McbA family metallohydrolase [Candidatus Omnitrophota bacterium]
MYIYFFPKQNFFKYFHVEKRPVWNLSHFKNTKKLINFLSIFYQIDLINCPSWKGDYSFIISLFSYAPENLKDQLPEEFYKVFPSSFICLLKNNNKPVIWIGGMNTYGLKSSLIFTKKILKFLTAKYLIAVDFHTHTIFSDGTLTPDKVFQFAVSSGLDAIAITDHNTTKGLKYISKKVPDSFPIIYGKEIKDKEGNHLLLLGKIKEIKNNDPPEKIIKIWEEKNLLVIQAHPTSSKYFVFKNKKGFGIEAFNYSSASPEKARKFAEKILKKGYSIPVVGVSDAHLAEDIGNAKTFVQTDDLESTTILKSVTKGKTVAFWRGHFCGEKNMVKILKYIYKNSNLLYGKLIPCSELIKKQNKIESNWYPIPLSLNHPGKKLFCEGLDCDCRETWFILNYNKKTMLKFGNSKDTLLKINKIVIPLQFYPGMDFDISPFLHSGENTIIIEDENLINSFRPRISIGKEIKTWELKIGNKFWKKIPSANNLQVLNILPVNYKGEIIYKTTIKVPEYFNNPTLFFEGTDGHIQIIINNKVILKRNNAHWWDRYEIHIPREKFLEIIVFLKNENGLCGITNKVFIGETIFLKCPETKFFIDKNMKDLRVLKCGEERVRGFLCNEKGEILRTVLAGSPLHPIEITPKLFVKWIVLNSFTEPLPFYQPYILIE